MSEQSPSDPPRRGYFRDPFLDRTAFGSVSDTTRVSRSWIQLQRIACQVLGLWAFVAWFLLAGIVALPIPAGIMAWIEAWGRWGLGGQWYIAVPLGALLFWQGMRPRFFQGVLMFLAGLLLLTPLPIAHFLPGIGTAPLVIAGFALVGAAQVWPAVEYLGAGRYRDSTVADRK